MISIIVPVYNVEKYVIKCLESIQNQTYQAFEVIIVDDGSTDSCGQLCEDFVSTDARFQVIHQVNGGLSAARNTGLDVAKGEYIVFIDSDDFIHPQMIEILYQCCTERNADISICKYRTIEEAEEIDSECINSEAFGVLEFSGVDSCRRIYTDSPVETVVSWNKMYHRSLFEDMRFPVGKIHEDEFVTYKILYSAKRVVYTDAVLYYYVQRSNSIMLDKNYGKNHMVLLEMAKESIDFYIQKQEEVLMKMTIERAFGLARMLYQKYGVARRSDLQKEVLRQYRELFEEYHRFMNLDVSSKFILKSYGYNPWFSQCISKCKHKLWLIKHGK